MNTRIIFSLIILVSIILIFIGSVFLQIVFSKKKNKFPGLILPLMTFLMTTIIVFGLYCLVAVKGTTSVYFSIIAMYLFFNIPTFIYLGIYLSYSKFRKELISPSQEEIIKMYIQDLG